MNRPASESSRFGPVLALALLAAPSAAQLSLIHELQGTTSPLPAGDRGHSVVSIGDVDGDGFEDFGFGETGPGMTIGAPGTVTLFSGADAELLATATGPTANADFAIAGGHDLRGGLEAVGCRNLRLPVRLTRYTRVWYP